MDDDASCVSNVNIINVTASDSHYHCSSITSFLAHVLTTGTAFVALGVISGMTCFILVLKSHSKLQKNYNEEASYDEASKKDQEEEDDETSKHSTFLFQRSCIVPLESLGLSYSSNFFLSALYPLMKKAPALMIHFSESVNDVVLTTVVCLPIGLYYFIWITLARTNPQVNSMNMSHTC